MQPMRAMIWPRTYDSRSFGLTRKPVVRSIHSRFPYWHFARSMGCHYLPTINDPVKPVKRKYAHIVLLNFCKIGNGPL
jgi:hypothetical protein